MNGSVWGPVLTAILALAGGFIGAMLQGTSSVRAWRRQTRLDAYAKFIDAEHRFHNAVIDAIAASLTPFAAAKMQVLLDAQLELGRTASVVSIAGPLPVVVQMVKLTEQAQVIMNDVGTTAEIAKIALEDKSPAGYGNLQGWIDTAERLEAMAREVLGTENRNGAKSLPLLRRRRKPAVLPAVEASNPET